MKKLKIFLNDKNQSPESETLTESKVETKEPDFFKVILLNDDFTPMEFVVEILTKVFHHDETKANEIMLDVHKKGAGTAGVFTFNVAETKTYIVNDQSQKNDFPLKAIMEKE